MKYVDLKQVLSPMIKYLVLVLQPGTREFKITNKCDYDMVITIKNFRTRRAVRTEYVRSGEDTSNRTNSKWKIYCRILQGINWSFNRRFSDGISKVGFLVDQSIKLQLMFGTIMVIRPLVIQIVLLVVGYHQMRFQKTSFLIDNG